MSWLELAAGAAVGYLGAKLFVKKDSSISDASEVETRLYLAEEQLLEAQEFLEIAEDEGLSDQERWDAAYDAVSEAQEARGKVRRLASIGSDEELVSGADSVLEDIDKFLEQAKQVKDEREVPINEEALARMREEYPEDYED